MKLRPYQAAGRDQILACIQRRAHVLYVLPTGGGKSVVIASVIAMLSGLGWRICLIAHRDELVQQLSGALTAAGVGHGVIAPGHDLTSHPVHVASVATLDRRRNDPCLRAWLASLDLLVPDEAHHVAAGQWGRIIDAAAGAVRFGATATPYRLDGKGLGDVFNEPVRGPSIRRLVRLGFLAPLKVYAPPIALDGLGSIGTRMGDYRRGDLARVLNRPEVRRAVVAHYGRLMPARRRWRSASIWSTSPTWTPTSTAPDGMPPASMARWPWPTAAGSSLTCGPAGYRSSAPATWSERGSTCPPWPVR